MKNKLKIAKAVIFMILLHGALGCLYGLTTSLITSDWNRLLHFILSGIACTVISGVIIRLLAKASTKKLIDKLFKEIEKVKEGDLTFAIDTKSFGLLGDLSNTINHVISDIRSLIQGFLQIYESIVESSAKVTNASELASASINEISLTTDEIAKGASEQAKEAQHGVEIVEALSKQIGFVYESYNKIMEETERINDLNNTGINSVTGLKEKSEQNSSALEQIFTVIEKLVNSVNDIGLFVDSIETVAEQTNLLALNAAIEAARAGESGKGFAVVAEEVRKLADESRKSTEEISSLMEGIREESQMAIESMDAVKKVSQEQNTAVNETNTAFNDIASGIISIIDKISDVNEAISKMQQDKEQVLASIENISSVSQQTAASSQEVAATTEHQLKSFEDMKNASETLNQLVGKVDERLKNYKV